MIPRDLKQLLKRIIGINSFATLSGTFLNGILGTLFFIIIARNLDPASLGLVSISLAVLTVAADISDLGISTGLINFISRNRQSSQEKVFGYMKLALKLKLLTWIFISFLGLLVSPFLASDIFLKPTLVFPLRLSFLGVGGLLLFAFLTSSLQALQRFWSWSILNIGINFIRILLVLLVGLWAGLNYINILLIYIGVLGVGFAGGLLMLPRGFWRAKDDNLLFQEFFHYNKWVALTIILSALYSRVDTFLITRFLNIQSVGIYSVATQLNSFMPQVVLALAVVVGPKLASLKNDSEAIKVLSKVQLRLLILSLAMLLAIPLAIVFIPVLYGVAYKDSISPFIILFVSQLFFLISLPAHQAIFYYFAKPRVFSFISAINFFLILAFGIILIPHYGTQGAALTILLGSIFNFVVPAVWVLSQFRFQLGAVREQV